MKLVVPIIAILAIATGFLFGYHYPIEFNFEQSVQNMPRNGLNIPAKWFLKDGFVGCEKLMLIFGYADNRDVCYSLVDMAREESPDIKFRCEDAH